MFDSAHIKPAGQPMMAGMLRSPIGASGSRTRVPGIRGQAIGKTRHVATRPANGDRSIQFQRR
jgi:hypothetical protein